MLIYPELLLQGKVLHRDFQAYYGPANLWLLAGVYHFIGISLVVERIVALVERTMLLTLLGWLALRLTGRATIAVLLAGLLVLTPLSLIALAWIPAVICSLAGLLVAGRVGQGKPGSFHSGAAFSGALMALSLQFRPDAGPAVLLASTIFLLAWQKTDRLRWIAGFVIGNIPMLIHLLTATPRAIWNNLIYYPLFIVKDGRIIHWADVKPVIQPLLWLYLLLALANIITGIYIWRRDPKNPSSLLHLAASVLGAGLAHQVFQRCDLAHLAMGSLLTLPLGAITIHFWLERWQPSKNGTLTTLAGSAICVVIFLVAAPAYFKQIALPQLIEAVTQRSASAISVVNGGRSYPISPPAAQFHATKIVEYINQHSQPGEKIFVGPGDLRRTFYADLYFYHLFLPKLSPSGYFIELNPLLTNSETSGIDQQIRGSQWVLLNQIYDHFYEANRSAELGSNKPGLVLKTHFQEVFRSGPFLVYRRIE